jgi:hypothetical protein
MTDVLFKYPDGVAVSRYFVDARVRPLVEAHRFPETALDSMAEGRRAGSVP